jgi:hypothetical protein
MARRRTVLLTMALVTATSVEHIGSLEPIDAAYFGLHGVRLLSRNALDVFSNPGLQVGPLQLALPGSARLAARWTPIGFLPALAFLTQGSFAALLLHTTRGIVQDETGEQRPLIEVAVVLGALTWGPAWNVYGDGHPA